MDQKSFSRNQIGALVWIIAFTIWGVWVIWLPLTRPLGINSIEILFLSALIPAAFILILLFALRVRWSYLNGILVIVGLWAGILKSLSEHSYFFSLTAYNLIAVFILLLSLLGFYFSVRSFLELPPGKLVSSVVGVAVLIGVSAAAAILVSQNQGNIENFVLRNVIRGVESRTGEIEDLDERIEALMAEGDLPSMAAAIIVDEQVVWSGAYGEDPDLDNLHDIGSATKSIIATGVLQLYEQGLIDLEDDVSDYLPFSVRHPDFPDTPITIYDLLANRACLTHNPPDYFYYIMGESLREWGRQHRGWKVRPEYKDLSYPDFMEDYLNPGGIYYQPGNWINCKPGSKFTYSSTGYDLLGYLIQEVSGKPLQEYLEENIFHPLQMFNTTSTALENPELIARPYERWYGVLSKNNVILPYYQRRLIGGGGLYSNIEDLSNFLIAHMNEGKYGNIQILKPETVVLMHSLISESRDDFMQVGYGLGWSLYQENPRQMWDITFNPRGYQGHSGRDFGYNGAMFMVDQKDGTYGMVILMNHSMVESMDQPWLFAIQHNIWELIHNEAERLYREVH
jgi:CubicO group peptidase (beta-lactamase class C family)